MKNNKINESLERIKFLTEFQYKTNKLETVEENPVKFNDIGDKYKSKPVSDYPTWEQYKDEVILDEDEPVDNEQQPQQPEAQVPPIPQGQAPVDAQSLPAPQPEQPPVAPEQSVPIAPQAPALPPPVAPVPTDLGNGGINAELDAKFDSQLAKTEELLLKIADIDQKLASVDSVSAQLNHVAKEVESIKNPSLDSQVDLISKQSYPYNIKLNDYWKWDEDETEKPEEKYTANTDDISYNRDDVRKSFNINETHISDIK